MKHMSRNVFIALLLLISTYSVAAQTVSYSYKPLTRKGCEVKYSVVKQDSAYYIIATVESERMYFLNNPTMKIRTFDDEVFALNGALLGHGSKSDGIVISNMILPITSINSTAQFAITPQQIGHLNSGVAKIRLSMTPMDHERTFKKDKIGKKLYKFYLKAKEREDYF